MATETRKKRKYDTKLSDSAQQHPITTPDELADRRTKSKTKTKPAVVKPAKTPVQSLAQVQPRKKVQKAPDLIEANILHEKWYTSQQLKALIQEGVSIKQGKWSELENKMLKTTIEGYLEENGLDQANLEVILFKDNAKKHPVFWRQIAAPFKTRPLRSVYHHVIQIYNPDNYGGKWTEEEDERLKSLVIQYGHQWKKIGEELGRNNSACKDRWRDYFGQGDNKSQGKWTRGEEDKLKGIVLELTTSQGRSANTDVMWKVVAERMGTRTSAQCRTKWVEGLNITENNKGAQPVWCPEDDLEMLRRIQNREYQHESEIHWASLSEDPKDDENPSWILRDSRRLRSRFSVLKKRLDQHQTKDLEDILDELIKNVQMELVDDEDEDEDGDNDE